MWTLFRMNFYLAHHYDIIWLFVTARFNKKVSSFSQFPVEGAFFLSLNNIIERPIPKLQQ